MKVNDALFIGFDTGEVLFEGGATDSVRMKRAKLNVTILRENRGANFRLQNVIFLNRPFGISFPLRFACS